MSKRISTVAGAVVLALGTAAPALALSQSERQQNANIAKALKTAKGASKNARTALKTANSTAKSVKSLKGTVNTLFAQLAALVGQINTYGSVAPELGVVTVYAGNGPPTPSSTPTPLTPIGTVWSSQIPRGGQNAADATGTVLYDCVGPAANPSAGCDLRLRAAIRSTRKASDVKGSVGGGFVITGIASGAAGAYAGARTGNGLAIANDPVTPVGFTSTAPTNTDGNLVTFTPGIGHLVGIESDHVTIHLQNPGFYEIQGTLQFFDSK